MPLEENLAMLSSKSIPPTPITSIWSAGLFRVLRKIEMGAVIIILSKLHYRSLIRFA